jgi:glycosyltransferase involved in cell wall biosynthesis
LEPSLTQPLRILHVVESLARGGLERVVCDLVLEQARQGHRVEVLCLFEADGFADELTGAGIPVIAANKQPGLDLSVLRTLRAASRRAGHQIVHTHNPVANYYACIAELTSWRSLPIVNTRHNMGASDPNDRREKLFRLSVARTSTVAMVSPQVSERFIKAGIVPAKKAAVVMNGIPLGRYVRATPATRATVRARLAIDADSLVVGCVGRLVNVKNHRMLLAAAAPICHSQPKVRIVLLGDGELRAELEQQARSLGIADAVRFFGERSDIPQVLPAFDVFAQPSRSEGHSIALLEAAAAGLPAVATAVGGNPEIVQHEVTGLLVPSEDVAALQGALASLLNDPARRESFASRARLWAESTISVEAMAGKYERIYRAVLHPSSTGRAA